MTFNDLGVKDSILQALSEKGYTSPTPIQSKAIPVVLQKKDLLGVAQTGTGKTAAFAIPIIQRLSEQPNKKRGIKALILTPTRELAIQIEENIELYAKNEDLSHLVIFGGVKQHQQVQRLKRSVDILVATPGRLLDLMNQGFISLNHIEIFVLDEADRMLDMGFIHDIKKVLKVLPAQRQSLFFSATMPNNIKELSREILKNPVSVEVTPASTTAQTVSQQVYFTNKDSKKDLLLSLLENEQMDQVLIFTRTKHGADRLTKELARKKIKAAAIHGNKSQNNRQRSLNDFKDKSLRVLVATDIAARGIDIEKLNWVVNYEIPNEPETYVHRIGRVGRAGETGTSISISEPEENDYIKGIEKLIKKSIPIAEHPDFPQTDKPMTAAEKKAFDKEKNQRKMEAIKARREKARSDRGGQDSRGRSRSGKRR